VLLGFELLCRPETGGDPCDQILGLIEEKGLLRRIFSVTIDYRVDENLMLPLLTSTLAIHLSFVRKRPLSTFFSDVGSGLHTGRNCYNVPTPTEETYPCSWEGNRLLMIRSGR
jgi:hypothetical protein